MKKEKQDWSEIISNYSLFVNDILFGENSKTPFWEIIKDEVNKRFTVMGPKFHDLDSLYLYEKLDRKDYLIQVTTSPINLEDGSFNSRNRIISCFEAMGFTWEAPEEMLSRLLQLLV